MTHLVDVAVRAGCTAVVMNYRGIEVELATPRTYCATDHDDLDLVVNHIHRKYKEHKIFGIGVSLGGIKLGGYLAKQYDDCLISNAMIVSAPFNVFFSCEELEKLITFLLLTDILAEVWGDIFQSKYFIRKNSNLFKYFLII